jgi:hypothetical protein
MTPSTKTLARVPASAAMLEQAPARARNDAVPGKLDSIISINFY